MSQSRIWDQVFGGFGPQLLAASHLQTARLVAVACFALLLLALGVGLVRARRQVETDEVDAALEADFLRIERELPRQLAPEREET